MMMIWDPSTTASWLVTFSCRRNSEAFSTFLVEFLGQKSRICKCLAFETHFNFLWQLFFSTSKTFFWCLSHWWTSSSNIPWNYICNFSHTCKIWLVISQSDPVPLWLILLIHCPSLRCFTQNLDDPTEPAFRVGHNENMWSSLRCKLDWVTFEPMILLFRPLHRLCSV